MLSAFIKATMKSVFSPLQHPWSVTLNAFFLLSRSAHCWIPGHAGLSLRLQDASETLFFLVEDFILEGRESHRALEASAGAEVMGQRAPGTPASSVHRDKSALPNVFLCGPLVHAGGRDEKKERRGKKGGVQKTLSVPSGERMHSLKVNSGTVKVQFTFLSCFKLTHAFLCRCSNGDRIFSRSIQLQLYFSLSVCLYMSVSVYPRLLPFIYMVYVCDIILLNLVPHLLITV